MEPVPSTSSADFTNQAILGILSIIDESSKNGTPKLGLLLAIINFCTKTASEIGALPEQMLITGDDLALAYLEVHWMHAIPYQGQDEPLIQIGNLNRDHFAVKICKELRDTLEEDNAKVSVLNSWEASQEALTQSHQKLFKKRIRETKEILWKNAVPRLQNLEGSEINFLYAVQTGSRNLLLNSNIPDLLLTFGPVLKVLIERRFAQIVEKLNPQVAGIQLADTIYAHLFMSNERVMPGVSTRKELGALQGGRCIWSGERIDRNSPADHVIPWHRKSISVVENFVLTTPSVNSRKSSHLISALLLERWLNYLSPNLKAFSEIGAESNLISDPSRCIRELRGLYFISEGAPLWNGPGRMRAPDPREILDCQEMLTEFISANNL